MALPIPLPTYPIRHQGTGPSAAAPDQYIDQNPSGVRINFLPDTEPTNNSLKWTTISFSHESVL